MAISCVLLCVMQVIGSYIGFQIGNSGMHRANIYAEFGVYGYKSALFRPNWMILLYVPFVVFFKQGLMAGILWFWYRRSLRTVRQWNMRCNVLYLTWGCIPVATLVLGTVAAVWHAADIALGNYTAWSWCGTCSRGPGIGLIFRDTKLQFMTAGVMVYGMLLARKHIRLGRKLRILLSDVRPT